MIGTGATLPGETARARWRAYLPRFSSNRLIVAGEFVVILLAWQWFSGVARIINPIFLPPPTQLVVGFEKVVGSGEIWGHLVPSLVAWSTGFALAMLAAIPFGLALGRSYPFRRLASPFVWSAYAVPWLAYQPLSKVWFGFGLAPVIFLVFIAAFFPTVLNTAAGVGTTRKSLLSAAKVFGGERAATLRKVVLPSSLPLMFAGIRQSVAMATIAVIVAEMNGPANGVGTMIIAKSQARAVDEAFAGILVAVVWTLAITRVVNFVADRVMPWRVDVRRS